MFELGALRNKPVAPEGKELRHTIPRSFNKALAGTGLEDEVAARFEPVPGAGLHLSSGLPGGVTEMAPRLL